MNPLLRLGPSLVLLVLAWRVHWIVRRFREAEATAPESARSLEELRIRGGRAVRLLSRRGVLAAVGDRYYLDEAAYARWNRRRRIALAIALSLVALLAIVLALTQSSP